MVVGIIIEVIITVTTAIIEAVGEAGTDTNQGLVPGIQRLRGLLA